MTIFRSEDLFWFQCLIILSLLGHIRLLLGYQIMLMGWFTDFTPFREFIISPIRIYYIHYRICQSEDYVYMINVWIVIIILTRLSLILGFIIDQLETNKCISDNRTLDVIGTLCCSRSPPCYGNPYRGVIEDPQSFAIRQSRHSPSCFI